MNMFIKARELFEKDYASQEVKATQGKGKMNKAQPKRKKYKK